MFEMQIQQRFSKFESYLRESEEEKKREREEARKISGERRCKERVRYASPLL